MANITVKTETYSAHFERVAPDLYYMGREVIHDRIDRDVDVFGHLWVLSWGVFPPGIIFAKRGDDYVELAGSGALFIPPFNLMEWELRPGRFEFDSLLGTAELPGDLPSVPVFFEWAEEEAPQSVEACFAIVRGAIGKRPVGRALAPDALARRAKVLIDAGFASETSIAEISRRLQAPPSALSRAFKRAYGLTPIGYRSKLRVNESLRLLLMEERAVGNVAYEVGFADLSRYNRMFRRTMRTAPSNYR